MKKPELNKPETRFIGVYKNPNYTHQKNYLRKSDVTGTITYKGQILQLVSITEQIQTLLWIDTNWGVQHNVPN